MKSPIFELNKIRRLIRTSGVEYAFLRDGLDEFKEPIEAVSVATIKGVFHQTTQHISVVASDAASVQTKQTPYILALYDDAKEVQQGDYTYIRGKRYTVNGVLDVNNWGIALDISLEVTPV